MSSRRQHILETESCGGKLRLVFAGTPLAVRAALAETLRRLGPQAVGEEDRGTLEIVLAEALNNVVEHAYADRTDGVIELHLEIGREVLCCEIVDEGRPMPEGTAPDPAFPAIEGGDEVLPEGGFGWSLIRTLCSEVDYRREGERNRLRFRLPLGVEA